jgi:hypothetical protein
MQIAVFGGAASGAGVALRTTLRGWKIPRPTFVRVDAVEPRDRGIEAVLDDVGFPGLETTGREHGGRSGNQAWHLFNAVWIRGEAERFCCYAHWLA